MQKLELKPAERLIVAADFMPPEADSWVESGPYSGESTICSSKRKWVRRQVINLAQKLKGTGVYVKVNSALRACGYDLIDELHDNGLRVFADLKLYDIDTTLKIDGKLLQEAKPDMLTTVCSAGVRAMKALKAELPNTEVVGVTYLTSLGDDEALAMFMCSTTEAVERFAKVGEKAEIDGLISSPSEAEAIREKFGVLMSINTPAIRPKWALVRGDDQNIKRTMTPELAINAGADRIVVGRPITQSSDPYAAVMRTIEEIARAA
ncbi:MAG: orotidine-5'-phosphate decarboxylase [Candidatus Zambryskibacteria bacterium CG10_big_fil_rev_8_21_14_0_10_42_12]|uniref:Orotidine 5'-phosphate decarboxylase n=1 Tax=Candidatus Zambryskibacteria bacterium CG10_big_fil_rev_8_21_14_0_10_42_12 TaxID=1975115 RepID=A0A2H0QX81_9BACT|nr:MAG: orotidine-5'-phosphate decarboxylase [Candidatus Zambryskibacteria bacterium CG10_big_fil_rev_8_21_14_0_10_42_12]